MRINVDMTNVDESGNFELVPEGIHEVEILECHDKQTKNADPMVAVKFAVTNGEHKDKWIWSNLVIATNPHSIAHKMLGQVKHFLKVIGQNAEGQILIDTDIWIGKKLRVEVYHEKYDGKTRAKVAQYLTKDEPSEYQIENQEETPF